MLYLLSVCLGLGYSVIIYIIKQAIGWAFWLHCCCSTAQLCLTLWDFMDCSMPGLLVLYHLLKFAQVHVHCIGDAIQPPHPLMPSYPYALNFPSIRDFSSESAVHIRWPKYWSFSFSNSPSNECSGLISLKSDWFDLLDVQGIRFWLYNHVKTLVTYSHSLSVC